jgi:ABC-type nitrate/sulfonate/bicarbonate transport system ATPase subunit
MVFQDYSLFPWLTVRENVAFGPKSRGERPESYGPKAERLLEIAKLTGFEEAFPGQLSGGMRQRVAIVRALANDPDVLLMDEPFGALDLQTRWQMQEFLLETKQVTQKTIVFVTHDIDEAVFVGDRIYIASPRPLSLGECFEVPFSPASRRDKLRRDPVFGALVNRVRDALLAAASKTPASK